MEEIIVTSQVELDTIPVDSGSRIIVKFGTPWNRAVINKRYKFSVEAWGNSSVEARENSSVVARETSSVVARETSSVEAWGNSSVVARETSSVVARENSSVEAWGNSSVEARGNSSVEAWGNSQINSKSPYCHIKISGNSRIVYDPRNIQEYIDFYGLESNETTVRLFKAVHKRDSKYFADWVYGFEYRIDEVAEADSLNTDVNEDCGHGIHMAFKEWAVDYGRYWDDLALLELEAEKDGVVVPLYGCGKVRAAKAKVIREVPLEECGLLGEMLAKERNNGN